MASCAGNFMKLFNFKQCQLVTNNFLRVANDFTQIRNYAARRGTRERKLKLLRAKKNSKKPEETKKSHIKTKTVVVPFNPLIKINEEMKPECKDDVVICKYYRWKVYDFAEAIQCHRETHHPTVYNQPEANVQAHIELDMTAVKKNRFVENFTRLAPISYGFPMEESRRIIVFCKTPELQNEAKEAGADAVGDVSLIKEIEKGAISVKEFDYVLAHPNALPDLVPIRGLLKRVYPNIRAGTLGIDLPDMIKKFRTGIKYTAKGDEYEPKYGLILANFGKLNMEVEHLQDNLQCLLRDVYSNRPKRPGRFITRVMVCCSPSVERFKLNLDALLPEQAQALEEEAEESDEEEEQTVSR